MVIGYHITNDGIFTSDGKLEVEHPLTFLVEYKSGEQKVCYDLDSNFASLMKLIDLTHDEGVKLRNTEKLYSAPWTIKYRQGKSFIIRNISTVQSAIFYNMAQTDYISKHYDEISSHDDSFKKAKEAELVANKVIEVYKSLGLQGEKLSSPISEFLVNKNLHLPTYKDVPEEVSQLANDTYIGNWFDVYKIGHFNNAKDYDINGSYGHELSRLYDIRRGDWVNSKDKPNKAIYGFARGILDIEAQFHPFCSSIENLNNSDDRQTFTLSGKYPKVLTQQSIELLYQHKLGTFKIKDAWWFVPNEKLYQPYKGVIEWLWNKRQGKTGIEKVIIQRIYSGLWGKMLEKYNDNLGDLYNIVYASIVATNSSLHVADTCLNLGIIPLAVLADGFITDEPVLLEASTKLGDWKLSAQGECIIANSNAITFKGKDKPEELALNYEWLYNEIQKNPKSDSYAIETYLPVTLGSALNRGIDKLGQVEKVRQSVIIGDNKRLRLDVPKNGKELLSMQSESIPLNYEYLVSNKKRQKQKVRIV